jgi:hypothetical protein
VTSQSTHRAEGVRGTQVERTALAWNRVAFALAANCGLLVRAGFIHHLVLLSAAGFAVGLIAFGLWSASLLRYSSIAGEAAPYVFSRKRRANPSLAGFVVVLSLVNLTVVVLVR